MPLTRLRPGSMTFSGWALLLGLLTFCLILALNRWVLPPIPTTSQVFGYFSVDQLRTKLLESGPIPHAILVVLGFGLWYLVLIADRHRRTMQQLAAIQAGSLPGLISEVSGRNAPGAALVPLLHRGLRLLAQERSPARLDAVRQQLLVEAEDELAGDFVAVRWAEWMLPLLGFLGTVVGVGVAIGEIKAGVSLIFQAGMLQAEAFEHLTSGFKGMALAFDTTFFGLAGVILVGGGHAYLRKRVSLQLGALRSIFESAVLICSEPAPQQLDSDLSPIAGRLARFEALFLHVVQNVPQLGELRRSLFVPSLRFEATNSAFVKTVNRLLVGLEGWSFVSLAAASTPRSTLVAAGLRDKRGRGKLLVADLQGAGHVSDLPGDPARVLLTPEGGRLLAIVQQERRRLVLVGKADGGSGLFGELVAERDTELARWDLRAPTQVMPCPGLRDALFVLQPGAGGARLGILEVEGEALEVSGVTANLGSLMGIRRLPETQLLMAEHDHGEMRIRSLPLPRGGRASNDWGHLGEGGTISAFPLRAPPRRVIGLECGAVLIMDERGRLFRWEERRGLLLGVDGWLPAKDTHLHHGASEWFAAFQGNHLRIRRLTAAGGLIAAEGEPEGGWALAAAVPRALAAIAPDGGTVFACVGRSIVPWGLPRRAYPEVGQDSPSGPGSATPGAGR